MFYKAVLLVLEGKPEKKEKHLPMLTEKELKVFIDMRIDQLWEEGAKADIDLKPALRDYYNRHMTDGTFISWLAVERSKLQHQIWGYCCIRILDLRRMEILCSISYRYKEVQDCCRAGDNRKIPMRMRNDCCHIKG